MVSQSAPAVTAPPSPKIRAQTVSALSHTKGLSITRVFTPPEATLKEILDHVVWETHDVEITSQSGEVVFAQPAVSAPADWSKTAVQIAASKYFRGQLGTVKREHSVRQIIERVVRTLSLWGTDQGYFYGPHRVAFEAELGWMLVHQVMAFNSPVWFNVGVEEEPQCSACFILGVEDSMPAILELAKTEGMIFKHGSGTGFNLSPLRSSREYLRGGGTASGPVSFMRGFDAFAGVIKSGGKTRRAAKMVILNIEHPDARQFIQCKATEERKAHALIAAGYDGSFNVPGGAYDSVFFQNANHSVRVSEDFLNAVAAGGPWNFKAVAGPQLFEAPPARTLWREIAEAAHLCGDPGLQFDDVIQLWNTCPNTARINGTNPCQPAEATVLTPQGVRTFADIDVGSVIWSGQQWTRVTRKVATGTKLVSRYHTRAGTFVGTSDHRVFQSGERVQAGLAETIDAVQGGVLEKGELRTQDVVDGWVLGDGSVHRASGDLVHLCLGKDDVVPFENLQVPMTHRPGISRYAWEVDTSLTAGDLPYTYLRRIPELYMRAAPNVVRGFLRGLYAANGSVCGNRITLKAASLGLIQDAQVLLSSLGIPSYFTVNHAHPVEFDNGTYECRESYDLNITHGRMKFMELIGFVHASKLDRVLTACAAAPSNKRKTSYEVTEVESLGEMPVWDIEVDAPEHSYWTGGLLVSNCSEYVFHDDTACNLASLNLLKFYDIGFAIEDFKHACSLTILAQEIMVTPSSYPTPKIKKNSHDLRPLGLGYANLGAMLMAMGLAYDSAEGRDVAAGVTALMTGQAYRTSAELTEVTGCFAEYPRNALEFQRVMRRHNDALRDVYVYEESPLHRAALDVWGDVLDLNAHSGFRNAQATVLAPTGTIGLMMDCDTTGVEPELALVKYKNLVGGGQMKLVNGTVGRGLRALGYADEQVSLIREYIEEHDTIEGAPGLRAEHLPVFDCSFRPRNGVRSIQPEGHVLMMAAVQPFLSGAISKTVNMPGNATVEDVERLHMLAYTEGLKSIAIYRDGCKRTQPLSTGNGASVAAPASAPPGRRKLPDERPSITRKFAVGGHEGYLHAGLYDDGTLGELFVTMNKEGSTVSGMMDAWATAVSLGLQHGVPLATFVEKFKHLRFAPDGFVPEFGFCTSPVDLIGKILERRFLAPALSAPGMTDLMIAPETVNAFLKNNPPVFQNISDAPPCSSCGALMVRNGACHKCLNCGTTSGCS